MTELIDLNSDEQVDWKNDYWKAFSILVRDTLLKVKQEQRDEALRDLEDMSSCHGSGLLDEVDLPATRRWNAAIEAAKKQHLT